MSKLTEPSILSRWTLIFAAAFMAAGSIFFCVAPLVKTGIIFAPPEPGDGPDYDNIAWNLVQNRGFGTAWNDKAWRAPYEKYSPPETFAGLLHRSGDFAPTAYRPPAYPFLLATLYQAFGRDFATPRIVNAIFFVLSLLLLAKILASNFGVVSALVLYALAFFDPSFILWTQSFYAEAFACMLVTLLLAGLHRHWQAPKGPLLGILMGLLVLIKSMFVLWIPVIAVVLALGRSSRRFSPRHTLPFLLGCLIPLAPWCARNILVTEAFLPLGTQAGPNLAYEFSDTALQTSGLWLGRFNSPILQTFYDTHPDVAGISQEVLLHRWGQEQAWLWVSNNWSAIPSLMMAKLHSYFWRDTIFPQRFLLLLSLLGLWLLRKRPDLCWPCLGILVAQTITIMLTHTVPAGRFLVPLYPVLYLLSAAGIAILGRAAWAKFIAFARMYGTKYPQQEDLN